MGMYLRKAAQKVAIDVTQQTAYGTTLAVDPTKSHPFDGSLIERPVEKTDDRDHVGKGHEFATMQENKFSDTRGSMTFLGSSWILGWAFAFANGSAIPTQLGTTSAYDHVCKMMNIDDPAVGKQLPVTTLVEELGTGVQKKYRDMLVKSLTLTGKTGEHLSCQTEVVGSGHWEASSVTMPDLVTTSFLRMADVVFSFNSIDISADVKDFSFKAVNEVDEGGGYFPGSGYLSAADGSPQVRGRCLLGKRTVDLSFTALLKDDSSFEAASLANSIVPLTITATGSVIEETYRHKLLLEFPKVAIKGTKIGADGEFFSYNIDCTVMWDTTLGAPYKATITNDVTQYLGT